MEKGNASSATQGGMASTGEEGIDVDTFCRGEKGKGMFSGAPEILTSYQKKKIHLQALFYG